MSKTYKVLFVLIFALILVAAGFTFVVREGSCAIVSRFGKIVDVHMDSGLHFKLPNPIDNVITYDTRSQYMDTGSTETLTNDKINIIMQTYLVWRINDAAKFHNSVGDYAVAEKHLNDIVANTKNGVLGNYVISSIVSTNLENIKIDEITKSIEGQVAQSAYNNYGIVIESLKIKRIAFPEANIESVYNQMIADRQKFVSQYIAEGRRDSSIITSEASAKAAEIVAAGKLEASEIYAETERQVASIYGDAYEKNSELFIFLKKLIALENSANPDTIIIMRADESPFDVITGNKIEGGTQ